MKAIRNAKAYKLIELKVINAWNQETDISTMMQSMTITESIFANGTQGMIHVADGIGLWEMLPFIGEERIKIKYQTSFADQDNALYEKIFNIYRIDNGKQYDGKTRSYIIHFISHETELNNNIKLSKSYNKMTSDIIVADIWDKLNVEELNSIEVSESAPRFIIPTWSPFKAIEWLSKNSISSDNDYNDYVLFENRKGWHWVTIRSLLKQSINQTIEYGTSTIKNAEGQTKNVIENIEYNRLYDTVQMTKDGLYGARRLTYSHINKSMNNEHTIQDDALYLNKPRLPAQSLRGSSRGAAWDHNIPDVNVADTLWGTEQYYEFLGDPMASYTVKCNDPETVYKGKHKHHLIRNQLFASIKSNTWSVTLPGNTSHYCGEVIFLNMPSFRDTIKNEGLDALNSGKYLVTAITHSLNMDEYTIELEIRNTGSKEDFATW